jgi:hypothetical protein
MGKRTNYESLGREDGFEVPPNVWNPDWEALLTHRSTPAGPSSVAKLTPATNSSKSNTNLIPTQREQRQDSDTNEELVPEELVAKNESILVPSGSADTQSLFALPSQFEATPLACPPPVSHWLFRGSLVPSFIRELATLSSEERGAALFKYMSDLRQKRGLSALGDVLADAERGSSSPCRLLQSALIAVNVNVIDRGSPEELAVIYAPTERALREYVESTALRVVCVRTIFLWL